MPTGEADLAVEDPVGPAGADGDDPGGQQPAITSAGASPRRLVVVLVVVATLFAALAVAMTVVAVQVRDDRGSGDETAVRSTAARFVEALVSFDVSGENPGRGTVEELGTGPLLAQYDGSATAFQELFAALELRSAEARIKEVYLEEIADGEADAIVVADLVLTGEVVKVVPDHYLRVHLVEIGGSWRVDNVLDVNTALAAGGSTSEGGTQDATTSTTAPPASTP